MTGARRSPGARARRPRLGAHVSVAGGLPVAVDRAVATGCDAIQIFTKSSSQWRARPLPPDEVETFRRRVDETGLGPNLAHASYLINIASPDATLRARSCAALREELERADALGLDGLVLHPGAYTTSTEEEGLQRIVESLARLFADHPPGSARLLLEHTAGQGSVLGHRFAHLRTILDGLERPARVAVCLDTCHLLAAGYDLVTPRGYRRVFEELDAEVGLDRVAAFHLNDSKMPLGSRRDRHEHIGEGHLGLAPFRRLLRDRRFAGLPMVLETAKTRGRPAGSREADPLDLRNLARLRALQ